MSSLWERKEEHGGCGNCNLKAFCKKTELRKTLAGELKFLNKINNICTRTDILIYKVTKRKWF